MNPQQKAQTIRVAAIQLNSRNNRERNLGRAVELMQRAVESGARIVALPENFSYVGEDLHEKLAQAESIETGASVGLLRAFASSNSVLVIGGSIPLRTDLPDKVSNTTLVVDREGSIVARYDKIHLFDADLGGETPYRESRYVAPGTRTVLFSTLGWTFGLSICYDLRFPELYRNLAGSGAEVLLVPSAFTRETGRDHWEVLLRARAVENLCYVIAPAQWGEHGGKRASYGRTMIVSPWGQILAECPDGEGFITVDLDMEAVHQARRKLPGFPGHQHH